MKELDLLKKDWKKQDDHLPHIKADIIYKMIHKRSSSLTRWILIIAIIEFILWSSLAFLNNTESSSEHLKRLHFYKANIMLNVINFSILAFFIFLLYKNYRSIRATDNARQLMHKILKVRRTVNYYVFYNLSMIFVSTIMVMTATYFYDPLAQKLLRLSNKGSLGSWSLLFISIIFILVLLLIFWLFYKLLYGIFLKRLRKNYKELNKLDFEEE